MKVAATPIRGFFICLMALLPSIGYGQSNDTKAIITYQQAEQAYAEGNFSKCTELIYEAYQYLEKGDPGTFKKAQHKIYYLSTKSLIGQNLWVGAKNQVDQYFDHKKEDLSDSKYVEMVQAQLQIDNQIELIKQIAKPFIGTWKLRGDIGGFGAEYLNKPYYKDGRFRVLTKQGELVISFDTYTLELSIKGQGAYKYASSNYSKREKDEYVYEYSFLIQDKQYIGGPLTEVYFNPLTDDFGTGGVKVSGTMPYSFTPPRSTGSLIEPYAAVISPPHRQNGSVYIGLAFVSKKKGLDYNGVLILEKQP
ncbi:hypothetical protein [Fibrella arboris]|uniref:hypothetical protein n=1 Tax=Fibrella arboris TaxID=3242486 RepID=UPI003522F5D0